MRKIIAVIVALAVAADVWAAEADGAAVYMVFKGDRPVLRIIDRPGPLTSTALPLPGAQPVRHPFLTASALDPSAEHPLRQILDASKSTAGFVEKLRQAGYGVRRE
jgi:hypothetical protein